MHSLGFGARGWRAAVAGIWVRGGLGVYGSG